MADGFAYDVFLSHSSEDKEVVREVAERLKGDGVKVWFDEWEIRPDDEPSTKIEEGLDQSRVLVLCMSAAAFGADWPQLESQTFRFRDPLNKERRFILLRLDEAPIKGSVAQLFYVKWWLPGERASEYRKLAEACRGSRNSVVNRESRGSSDACSEGEGLIGAAQSDTFSGVVRNGAFQQEEGGASSQVSGEFLGQIDSTRAAAWSVDGRHILSTTWNCRIAVWEVESRERLRDLGGHSGTVTSVAWCPLGRRSLAISASDDRTIRLWDVAAADCLTAC